MGEAELKAALQKEMDARIRTVWQKAEAAVAARRDELESQQAAQEEAAEAHWATERRALHAELIGRAEQQARRLRLEAEARFCTRLKRLGEQLLPELGDADRQIYWDALVTELPGEQWETVRVHPDDRERAGETFADAEIILDEDLAGGFVASRSGDRVTVDNSLKQRYCRAWPDLLPALLAALHDEVDDDTGTETTS